LQEAYGAAVVLGLAAGPPISKCVLNSRVLQASEVLVGVQGDQICKVRHVKGRYSSSSTARIQFWSWGTLCWIALLYLLDLPTQPDKAKLEP